MNSGPAFDLAFEIICNGCGASIYSGLDLKYAKDVLKLYGGKCRKCGVALSVQDFSIDVVRAS